jgi:hypothetical protein
MVRISLKFRRQAGQIPPAAAAQGSAGTNPAPVAPNPASAPSLSSSAPAVSPALPGNPLPSVNHLAATPLPPNVAAPGVGGAAATPSTWNGAPSTASSVVPPPPPSNTAAQGMGGTAATSSSSGMTGPWTDSSSQPQVGPGAVAAVGAVGAPAPSPSQAPSLPMSAPPLDMLSASVFVTANGPAGALSYGEAITSALLRAFDEQAERDYQDLLVAMRKEIDTAKSLRVAAGNMDWIWSHEDWFFCEVEDVAMDPRRYVSLCVLLCRSCCSRKKKGGANAGFRGS